MLATMTSLVTLAYAARPTTPPFNHDFYVTAATVIPVLFLAINVQPIFQGLGFTAPERRDKTRSQDRLMAVLVATAIVYFFMVVGIAGEIAAIFVLSNQTAGPNLHRFVLVTMILLTFAAGLGPLLGAFSDYVRFGEPASAETGKTDPV
jgi:hypothetical protein